MPTITRKNREELVKARKRLENLSWRLEIAMAQPHTKKRIGRSLSEASTNLMNALSLKGSPYNRVGCVYDKDTGEPFKITIPYGLGANLERQENREDTARGLRQKYNSIWTMRGTAKQIAHAEGLTVRTIQKYMKEFP